MMFSLVAGVDGLLVDEPSFGVNARDTIMLRHRSFSIVAMAAAVSLLSLVPITAASAGTVEFFAAPDGAGSSCSLTAPCSLEGARNAVRAAAPGMASDLVVNLRGGTYRMAAPLELGVADSGQNGKTVQWRAYQSEKPIFSGAKKVTGWTISDPVKNIYRAKVPAGTISRQLYVDGERATRARSGLNPAGFSKTAAGFSSTNPVFASWRNPTSIEIVGRNAWKHLRCPVQTVTRSGAGSAFAMQNPCWANAGTAPNPDFYFPYNGSGRIGLDTVSWIENAYELLDQPGEFYLDSQAGDLYYSPKPGQNLATADVELPLAEGLVRLAGTPGQLTPVNNDDPSISYRGSWATDKNRTFGDLRDDVSYTKVNGDSATITFTGTGIDVLSEKSKDQGDIEVTVDGVPDKTVSASTGAERLAQQVLYSKTGLAPGVHTIKLTKKSGQFMLVDGYVPVTTPIQPVHDISFSGVAFEYTTWLQPSSPQGYADNQAGVSWVGSPAKIARTPGAFRVERGQRVTISGSVFQRLGGSGVDFGYGSQDSSVLGNRIEDVSGGGVSIGEFDDFWLTDAARMTSGILVKNNAISKIGKDYEDAAAISAGFTRTTTISQNQISDTPYSGISLGWGWGWDSVKGGSRHGTNYARENAITNNDISNVMKVLNDGGPIYVLGGQGDGSVKSVMSGNVLSKTTPAQSAAQALYPDEGSSWWEIFDNVVSQVSQNWNMEWTSTVHDINVRNNFTDVAREQNNGTNVTVTGTTLVTDGNWPTKARQLVARAGLEPAYKYLATPKLGLGNDGEYGDLLNPVRIKYSPDWQFSERRSTGDLNQDLHTASKNGASVTFSFTGSSLSVLAPLAANQGRLGVTLDGVAKGAVETFAATTALQQTIYSTGKLPYGQHTLTLTKQSGSVASIDGYLIDKTTDGSLTPAK